MRPKIKVYRPGDVYDYAHLKRDGIWLTLTRETFLIKAETRHPTDVTEQLLKHPVIHSFSDHARVARVYCELFVPGQQASAVKNRLAEGRVEEMRIESFASPDLAPETPLHDVRDYCEVTCGVPFAPWWVAGHEPDWRELPDAEGLVYKDGNLLNWAKEKREATVDCVVTGTQDGNGKYLGLLGALVVAIEGREVARVSGMTDADRIRMSDEEESLPGRVCEVKYQYVGAKGRLRHPRFVRWRDDKRPDECTLDQDPDLEEYWRR